jgi:hypothetical protein
MHNTERLVASCHCSERSCPVDDKIDEWGSFYEELGRMFYKIPKYHMKILLGDFNVNAGREDICELTIRNAS